LTGLPKLRRGNFTAAVPAAGYTSAVPANWEVRTSKFELSKLIKAISQSGFVVEIPKMFKFVRANFSL
jgi:hypothetical protein